MKQELQQQLHDIEGIGDVSMWPLAIGYWILIASILGVVIYGCFWICYYFSWKRKAHLELRQIEKTFSLEELSLVLRKIVLKRFKREECAGLFGVRWLMWLKEKDPNQFDWVEKGKILLSAPYSPQNSFSKNEAEELIKAVKRWVR